MELHIGRREEYYQKHPIAYDPRQGCMVTGSGTGVYSLGIIWHTTNWKHGLGLTGFDWFNLKPGPNYSRWQALRNTLWFKADYPDYQHWRFLIFVYARQQV